MKKMSLNQDLNLKILMKKEDVVVESHFIFKNLNINDVKKMFVGTVSI